MRLHEEGQSLSDQIARFLTRVQLKWAQSEIGEFLVKIPDEYETELYVEQIKSWIAILLIGNIKKSNILWNPFIEITTKIHHLESHAVIR